MLNEKTKAPDFSLSDSGGKIHQLSDYLGKWVLIYFYPKDDTPGCTKEACSFRDLQPDFSKLGLTVLGISADPEQSHQKFANKYSLNFTLLSDSTKETIKAYGAGGAFTRRISYLVGPDGVIYKAYPKVKAEVHAEEVLGDYKKIYAEYSGK